MSILFGRPKKEKEKLLETCLPLSMWDRERLRRALLHFQLYCELFHQPRDSSDAVNDWEERLSEQEFFWLRYEWWEVEEVKCIYQLLVYCLEDDLSIEPLVSDSEIAEGGRLQERGLPQLRHFLDNTETTAFGKTYLRRFMSRAFNGFSKAYPDDLNYCSQPRPQYRTSNAASGWIPPGTYRTFNLGSKQSRR